MPFDTAPRPSFLETAREIVSGQQNRRAEEARRQSGVRWSGMDCEPFPVETVDACAARLEREHAAREAFFATPRGRYLRAVNSLGGLGYTEADALLSIYSRTLADADAPMDERRVDAIGRAIRVLNGIAHSHAREAIAALADLLAAPLARAA